MQTLKRGDVVRPVVSLAELDSRRMYRVVHVESPTPFSCNVYLEDIASGLGLLAPIEHADLVLEHVRTVNRQPTVALFN